MPRLAALSLAFVMANAHPAGVIAVGDSITAQRTSWPSYLRDEHHIMVMAQNGRATKGFSFPADLRADKNVDIVVYFLGSNDVINVDLAAFYSRAKRQLDFLKARKFKLVVVLPPRFTFREVESNMVRFCLLWAALTVGAEVVDLDPIWDAGLTLDLVHPNDELSERIAYAIETALRRVGNE